MTIDIALRHRFGDFALDAAFSIDRPGITALFGPSGSGKSTIASAIAGLLRPAHGRVVIGEQVVFDSQAGIFIAPRFRRVGCVFQDARLFPHMSVENNLRFGWRRVRDRADEHFFTRIVDLLGLAHLLARRPAGLSGGEKSRVALGRALLASPNLLVLDEPLAALDAERKAEILPWFEKLRDDAALPMIYVTHSLDEVARLADNVVLLREGQVAAQGATFDMLPDLDFAKRAGVKPLGAVFAATIVAGRESEGLSTLAFDGGAIVVSHLKRAIGSAVRVRLKADDVMLAGVAPDAISANNVFSAVVTAVHLADDAHADVQLALGGVKIIACITRSSLERLGIKPGMPIFAIVKSVTVDSR